MKIKSIIFSFCLLLLPCLNVIAQDDVIKAMREEMSRSMDKLKLESLQKPYYIEYRITSHDSYSFMASLGSLTESKTQRNTELTVIVRVGSYKFDNGNFIDFSRFFGGGDDEEEYSSRTLPIDLDARELRRQLWLSTDAAYKQAAEQLSKKEAALKNKVRQDTTHDFLYVEPVKFYDKTDFPKIDMNKYELLVKKLSGIFSQYPDIQVSNIGFEYNPEINYFVNSEGREFIKTESFCGLEAVAITQNPDGMQFIDFFTSMGMTPANIASEDSLMNGVKNLADNLNNLRIAKTLEEPYSGPVLFSPFAAAQLFSQVFAPNLVAQRQPVSETSFGSDNEKSMAFQSKIGGRVLPEFMNVTADPTLDKFDSTSLLGYYKTDDDGQNAEKVNLVVNGFLKDLLSSRVPTRRIRHSNGHKRGGSPMLSNIFISSDEEHSKPDQELKERLLELCRDRELPFAVIVNKIVDMNILFTTVYRLTGSSLSGAKGGSSKFIIEALKVYPDGREELIRGVEAKGISVATFKDILLTGQKPYLLNYLAPSVVSSFMTGGKQFVPTSMAVPSLLFEDCEIKPLEEDFPKPPLLLNPISNK